MDVDKSLASIRSHRSNKDEDQDDTPFSVGDWLPSWIDVLSDGALCFPLMVVLVVLSSPLCQGLHKHLMHCQHVCRVLPIQPVLAGRLCCCGNPPGVLQATTVIAKMTSCLVCADHHFAVLFGHRLLRWSQHSGLDPLVLCPHPHVHVVHCPCQRQRETGKSASHHTGGRRMSLPVFH